MRKLGCSVALAGLVVFGLGAFITPAGAGDTVEGTTTIIVKKVVTGPATAGTTVVVACSSDDTATLTFDITGAPATSSTNEFVKANGAWVFEGPLPDEPVECSFTETVTGGAQSTAFTCTYAFTLLDVPKSQGQEEPRGGCDASAGTGPGPVSVGYQPQGGDLATQTSTVT